MTFSPNFMLRRSTRDYYAIDLDVAPLVDALNSTGQATTIASCQGHAWGNLPPYVYFYATPGFAAQLERQLRENADESENALNATWCIQGQFDGSYKLAYLLFSSEYHRRAEYALDGLWTFGVRRRLIRSDLLALTAHVKKAMRANVRQRDKPKVADCSKYQYDGNGPLY